MLDGFFCPRGGLVVGVSELEAGAADAHAAGLANIFCQFGRDLFADVDGLGGAGVFQSGLKLGHELSAQVVGSGVGLIDGGLDVGAGRIGDGLPGVGGFSTPATDHHQQAQGEDQ